MKAWQLTTPWAILIGSGVIAAGLIAAPLMAPYRVLSGASPAYLRFNTLTGSGRLCALQKDPWEKRFDLNCDYDRP